MKRGRACVLPGLGVLIFESAWEGEPVSLRNKRAIQQHLGKSILGWGRCWCKGPKEGTYWTCLRKNREASVPVSGSTRGRLDEMRAGIANQVALTWWEFWYLSWLKREATGGSGGIIWFVLTGSSWLLCSKEARGEPIGGHCNNSDRNYDLGWDGGTGRSSTWLNGGFLLKVVCSWAGYGTWEKEQNHRQHWDTKSLKT